MRLGITITGVDAKTPLLPLAELLGDLGHGVELGFLYSAKRAGRWRRYPTLSQIARSLEIIGTTVHTAVHVCGSGARAELLSGDPLSRNFFVLPDRIQINGEVTEDEAMMAHRLHDKPIITQWVPGQASSAEHWPRRLLFDGSGGRGISPTQWVRPPSNGPAGFAGGLAPGNLESEIVRIEQVACDGDWIDMESGVRDDNDWLDLGKVQEVIEIRDKRTAPETES